VEGDRAIGFIDLYAMEFSNKCDSSDVLSFSLKA